MVGLLEGSSEVASECRNEGVKLRAAGTSMAGADCLAEIDRKQFLSLQHPPLRPSNFVSLDASNHFSRCRVAKVTNTCTQSSRRMSSQQAVGTIPSPNLDDTEIEQPPERVPTALAAPLASQALPAAMKKRPPSFRVKKQAQGGHFPLEVPRHPQSNIHRDVQIASLLTLQPDEGDPIEKAAKHLRKWSKKKRMGRIRSKTRRDIACLKNQRGGPIDGGLSEDGQPPTEFNGGSSSGVRGHIDLENGPQVRSDIVTSSRRLDFRYYSNNNHHANTISHDAASTNGLPRAQGPLIPRPAFSSPKVKQRLHGKNLRYFNHPSNSSELWATPIFQNDSGKQPQELTVS